MGRNKRCYIVSYHGISKGAGVERVCYYIDRVVPDLGYDTKIIDLSIIEKYWLGAVVRFLFGKIPALTFPLLTSLFILTHKKKGDIVFSHGYNAPFCRADFMFVHGTWIGVIKGLKKSKYSIHDRVILLYERIGIVFARKVVCVSNLCKQEVIESYYRSAAGKTIVLFNTVDDEIFFPKTSKDSSKCLIGFCGRLEEIKGLDQLLRLAASIEHTDEFQLHIGCLPSPNVELFKSYNNTIFHININLEKLNDFYNMVDVIFFPSNYEGFEMVTLEALSAGTPVVGNKVGAIAEFVSLKEPGVVIIDYANCLHQLKSTASYYRSLNQKMRLHRYYAEKYGKLRYKESIEQLINSINQ